MFDSRGVNQVRLLADSKRTPSGLTNQVGWLCALVWPIVGTAVVAGALLGSSGRLLLVAGALGSLAMLARQGARILARKVREANLVIDNAPGRHPDL